MIIRKHNRVIYCVEFTSQQFEHLQLLMETGKGSHINELTLQADHGSALAEDAHETFKDLRESMAEL